MQSAFVMNHNTLGEAFYQQHEKDVGKWRKNELTGHASSQTLTLSCVVTWVVAITYINMGDAMLF